MKGNAERLKNEIMSIMSTSGMPITAICGFDRIKEHLIKCHAVERLPKNPKSLIMAVFPYKVKENPPKNISRYAAIPDYHDVCGDMLKRAAEELKKHYVNYSFEAFIDSSPIPEVRAAASCGLGVIGKNGLLINKEYGSYVFIGEIVTDLTISEDFGFEECLDCGQCISSCNTFVSKKNCLSAVNQKKKLENEAEIEQIRQSNCVWGCDICSEVCPMNSFAKLTYIQKFTDGYRDFYSPDEDFTGRPYCWRGPDLIKRNYKIINKEKL